MLFRMPRKLVTVATFLSIFLVFGYLLLVDKDPISVPYITSPPLRTSNLGPVDSPWTRRVERYPVDSFKQLPVGNPVAFPKVQAKAVAESSQAKVIRETRLSAVKEAFIHSWKGYREHAWLADELKPVTGGQHAAFGNWSATLVDSLDTLWIMDLHQEFDEAVLAIADINFEISTSKTISVFETTIRYLGGLLSAYELSYRPVLLRKALELGHFLYAAFDTPSRMPIPHFNWANALDNNVQDTTNHAAIADIGSLSMEFTKLSQLSGDPRFFDAVQRISDLFAEQQNNSTIPGLWPVFADPMEKDFATGYEFSFGALADSLYEYTAKSHILLGGLVPEYGAMYEKAIDTAKRTLFVRAMNPENKDLLFSTVVRSIQGHESSDLSGQHLACFVGGLVGMGSKLFKRDDDLRIAEMLSNGCHWAYGAMKSGIMPETIKIIPCPSNDEQCAWDEKAWKEAVLSNAGDSDTRTADEMIKEKGLATGFASIPDGRYILRPEAIESLFYMYRITGQTSWQDKAWSMFQAIEKATRTKYGYSAIENVAAKELHHVDSMESFWTAETLKYLYLIFSDPELISLDEWVFNTEAHPFRRLLPKRGFWG